MLTPAIIASMLDHSTLQPFLTEEDIIKGCDIARKYRTASVCARPADMPLVATLLQGSAVQVCTVIGFPHGNHHTCIKVAEAQQALLDGCNELDMVINVGKVRHGDYAYVENEIRLLCDLAHKNNARVKVILETCFLSDEQIAKVCQLSADAGCDWVKTSTGYGSAGYTPHHLRIMKDNVPACVELKASGGIRTLDQVLEARAIGASRCGVSATEAIMKEAIARFEANTLVELTETELKQRLAQKEQPTSASY